MVKITEVILILVHCYIDNIDIQQDSRVLWTFVPNKSIKVSPTNFIFLKTFNSDFSYIKVRFTDQNSKPLEIGHKM